MGIIKKVTSKVKKYSKRSANELSQAVKTGSNIDRKGIVMGLYSGGYIPKRKRNKKKRGRKIVIYTR